MLESGRLCTQHFVKAWNTRHKRCSTISTASTPTSQLLHDLDRYESVFRGAVRRRVVAIFEALLSDQDPECADMERFVGFFMGLAESISTLRTSLSDSSCSGETFSNLVVDFDISVEARNSTSPTSRSCLTLARPTPIFEIQLERTVPAAHHLSSGRNS